MAQNRENCERCKKEVTKCYSVSVSDDGSLSESELPVKLIQINGQPKIHTSDETIDCGEKGFLKRKIFTESHQWSHRNYRFYTVRVCWECQSDWIRDFTSWLENPPTTDDEPCAVFEIFPTME